MGLPRIFARIRSARTIVSGIGLALAATLGSAPTPALAEALMQVDLLEQDGLVSQDGFGDVVAVAGDTVVVAMGPFGTVANDGRVFVYERIDGSWTFKQELEPTNPLPEQFQFGASADIAGGMIAVGAPHIYDGSPGYVFLYERIEGNWQPVDRLEPPPGDAHYPQYGYTVAFGEGQLFVQDHDQATLHAYGWDGASWQFEESFSLSARTFSVGGPYLLIGNRNANLGAGEASVYQKVEGAWTFLQTLTASDAEQGDFFGSAMHVEGQRIVVQAGNGDSPTHNTVGAVYIFELKEGAWVEVDKVHPRLTDLSNNQRFGTVVRLDGERLYLSSFYDEDLEVFEAVAGQWVRMGSAKPRINYRIAAIGAVGDEILVGGQGTDAEEDEANVRVYQYDPRPALASHLKAALFPEAAADNEFWAANEAAFRYREEIYTEQAGEVEADFTVMAELYGDAERERVALAMADLDQFLSSYDIDDELAELGLDLHYYAAQAEAIHAGNAARAAAKARLGPPFAPIQPAEWAIDYELALASDAVTAYEAALGAYFKLFSAAPGHEAGAAALRSAFVERQAERAYRPSQAILDDQEPDEPETLFSGYKDLVFVLQLLQKYGESAREQAWLQVAAGDKDAGLETIDAVQRSLFLHGSLVLDMFPDLDYDSVEGSGLGPAVAGWRAAIGQLEGDRAIARGEVDALGFDPDFLLLTQRATFQQTQDYIYDSYDVFAQFLDPLSSTSPLKQALEDQADAIAAYQTYRDNQDNLAEQYTLSTVSYESRLFEIVGARPGEAGYDDPGSVEGSELWQQLRSIEQARLQIRRNSVEIGNLHEEVSIELERSGAVQSAVVKYGNKQAKLTQKIAHIKAAQSFMDSLTNPAKWSKGGFVLAGVNGLVQAAAEEGAAHFEGQKEKLAAEEKAEIEGINSAAYVKTLLLEMNVLLVDSQEALLLLRQEYGRYRQLLREKADLERRIEEREASLAKRYYADPIHQLIANNGVVVSNNSFDEAQRWLFFMARALEYKWNDRFRWDDGLKEWALASVYSCRNAAELEDFYQSMALFNESFENTTSLDDRYDWFSVKEDFLGLRELDDNGESAVYYNPDTGEPETATEAFRRKLAELTDSQGRIRIRFSTVRQIPGGTFFLGPRYNTDGSLSDSGLYLDKIRWMKIRVPGEHTTARSTVSGSLRYGGASFVRKQRVGATDPQRPDQVEDEMTAYSTRYQFFDGDRYVKNDALTVTVTMEKADADTPRPEGLPTQIDILPSVQQIDSFRERSVAATDWELTINARDLGATILDANEVDDIEIYFYHWAAERID